MSLTLGDLFRWCETTTPEAPETVIPSISTTQLCKRDILNEGAVEFCKLTKCFPREKKINCTANNYTYTLSTNIPDFLDMREEGIWHLRSDSSTSTWDRLKPTTVRTLDQVFTTWRDQSASDEIRYYWQDGDTIGLFYTPSSTVTNGLWVYYYGASSDMSSTTQYPFTGTTTEDPRLKPYAKYLLTYYEHKANDILGYKDTASNKLQEFVLMCQKAKSELQTRRDLVQEAKIRVKSFVNRGMFK